MALTAQQTADVRRWAGYPSLGTDTPADATRDFAYGWVSPGVWQTMFTRLANMPAEVESTLINVYLSNLTVLEAAIVGAGANLDTDVAAVWTRNRSEVSDRMRLFDDWRRRMCQFLGIPPGPYLGQSGGMRLVRC
jgi:hypothetical protein